MADDSYDNIPPVIPANYPSWCVVCAEPIDVGDPITPNENDQWVHEECA